DKLLKVLSDWRTPEKMFDFWKATSTEHQQLVKFVGDTKSDRKCFIWASTGEALRKSPDRPSDGADLLLLSGVKFASIEKIFLTWPLHPRFFQDGASSRPGPREDEDDSGTFFSQLSYYVFATISNYLTQTL